MTDILLKEKIKKKSSMCYNIKKNDLRDLRSITKIV